ncbi:Proto-oncogene tyrosine-protein kinase receptor ret, partial [Gryllus bimaculatus]
MRRVRVWWSGGGEAETSFEVSVRLVTQASSRCATAPPTERQFHCADFATAHDCTRHCAQGVGAARPRKGDAVAKAADVDSTCTWRSIGPSRPQAHANFTTCTPDVLTCPDGECDELERENKFLCPQDCVWKDDNDMHMAYNAHGQGIAMAPGICSCSLPHKCVCLHEPPTPPAPPAPP